MSDGSGAAAASAPRPASASASRSAPSFAAQPPQSVSSVRRIGAGSRAVMATMIGLPSRWERSGPGGSPGLQNQWRGARRGAVGSTPTRSRHGGPVSTDRPRPPSVERLLRAVRPQLADGAAADAVAAVAREVVADERARLAAGEEPTTVGALAADVQDRLQDFTH